MALKKYDQDLIDKIVTSVDTELGDSWNYGSDDLSYLRREYIDRFFRLDNGMEEPGFSTYHSPLIQNTVLQARAYMMRPYNKSKKPIMKFPEEVSTVFMNQLFRNELNGKKLLSDAAWYGALLKTMAAKVYVKPELVVDEDYAVFEGPSKSEIEDEIDIFFAEDEELIQIGKIKWEKVEVELKAYEVPTPPPSPGTPPGVVPPEAQEAVAELAETAQTAPEELPTPDVEEEETLWSATVRFKKERIERKTKIDVIPPYEFHISRQSPSQEDAAIVGRVHPMTISDMRTCFPDAPKLNGFKNKKEAEKFWGDINGEWLGWTQQNEWYEMWLKDNSSYYEGYYFNVAQETDSPARAYLVADVDIQLDPYDEGTAKWYNVIKVGQYILSCTEISQPSFKVGSLIDVAGRWLGLSLADLNWDEDTSITNNMRAADNSILKSTYANPIIDEEQVRIEDVLNAAPDSVIRRQLNAVPKQGVAAVEWTKHPGLDGQVFSLIDKYQEFSGTATGTGKFFQGHDQDNISSTRVTAETAKIIENNSDLMLDEISSNFWDFWRDVLIMAHNASIIGEATPISFMHDGEHLTISPMEDLKIVKQGEIDIAIGSNEESNKLEQAQNILKTIVELETTAPSLAAMISPEGKAAAMAELFKALGAENAEQYLTPQNNDPLAAPEVQEAIAQAQQSAEQQAQQQVEDYKNSLDVQMKIRDQEHRHRMEEMQLNFKKEDAAAAHAYKYELSDQSQQKIDDRKEVDAAQIGLGEEKLAHERENSDREYQLAKSQGIRTDI